MTSLSIKKIEIGRGIPKICVPLVGKNRCEIFEEISLIDKVPCHIVEWRADFYADASVDSILALLSEINARLGKKILLFTFRSESEGGAFISKENYRILYENVICSGFADIVDIELFMGTDIIAELVHASNSSNVYILMSNHDFTATPNKETIINRLCKMHELGADIAKIAVMPRAVKDVAILIDAMAEMEECYAVKPFCAISMSPLGFVSRIIGETFGSCITYASLSEASAPGQANAANIASLLKTIHKSVDNLY